MCGGGASKGERVCVVEGPPRVRGVCGGGTSKGERECVVEGPPRVRGSVWWRGLQG